jgi:hypothetical protein
MPPLPVIANTYRVAHEYHVGAVQYVNVWNIKSRATTTSFTVADRFLANYGSDDADSLIGIHSQSVTFDRVAVTAYDGVSPTLVAEYPASTLGGAVLGPAPAQCCGILTLETGTRGRSFRGRVFLGGLPDAFMESDGSQWTPSFQTDVGPMIEEWISSWQTGSPAMDIAVVSLVHGVATPVTTMVPRRYMGTVRNRAERAE